MPFLGVSFHFLIEDQDTLIQSWAFMQSHYKVDIWMKQNSWEKIRHLNIPFGDLNLRYCLCLFMRKIYIVLNSSLLLL